MPVLQSSENRSGTMSSCDGSHCAPKHVGAWSGWFAWRPVRANLGWRWLCWLWRCRVQIGGHGEVRYVWDYRRVF